MTFNHFLLSVGKASATNLQHYVLSVVSSIVTFFGTSFVSSCIEQLMAEVLYFPMAKSLFFFFLQFI
jgi:hypothetical protein